MIQKNYRIDSIIYVVNYSEKIFRCRLNLIPITLIPSHSFLVVSQQQGMRASPYGNEEEGKQVGNQLAWET